MGITLKHVLTGFAVLFLLFVIIVLLYMPCCAPVPFTRSLNEQATNFLKNNVNNLRMPQKTQPVTWHNGNVLYSRSAAESSGSISPDQVCILRGDLAQDSRFDSKGKEGELLEYVGTTPLNTRLLVLCDYAETLQETANEYGYAWANQIGECKCVRELPENGENKCCIVAVAGPAYVSNQSFPAGGWGSLLTIMFGAIIFSIIVSFGWVAFKHEKLTLKVLAKKFAIVLIAVLSFLIVFAIFTMPLP